MGLDAVESHPVVAPPRAGVGGGGAIEGVCVNALVIMHSWARRKSTVLHGACNPSHATV